MTGLVTVTAETIGARMAGPAIRALELTAAVVAAGHPATLVSLQPPDPRRDPAGAGHPAAAAAQVEAVSARGAALRALVEKADCLLLQGDVLGLEPWLRSSHVPIVVDVYDPFHFEQLEQTRQLSEPRRRAVVRDCVTSLNRQLSRADLVLAASARQRDLWIGHLAALGRVNPVTYDAAPDLSGLIRIVPFGLPDRPPNRGSARGLRASLPGVPESATIALWAGGLYDWFDPGLVIRALRAARRGGRDLHLVFMGAAHPVLGRPTTAEIAARATVRELGMTEVVHFAPDWVPYADRVAWLLDADMGVFAHRAGIEAEFAFRTRLLDHLWTGLPTVGTSGDALGDLIAAAGAGRTAEPGDVEGFATAMDLLGGQDAAASASHRAGDLAAEFGWSRVAVPLVEFVADPHRAPDLLTTPAQRALLGLREPTLSRSPIHRLRGALAEGGPALVGRRIRQRLRTR